MRTALYEPSRIVLVFVLVLVLDPFARFMVPMRVEKTSRLSMIWAGKMASRKGRKVRRRMDLIDYENEDDDEDDSVVHGRNAR
jgi:hypothetical protein